MPTLNTSAIAWLRKIQRAFSWKVHSVPVTDLERSQLAKKEIHDEQLLCWAVWRRSVLLVILLPTLLSAFLHTIGHALHSSSNLSLIGQLLLFANTFILWAVPLTAGYALWNWTNLPRSQRILRICWLITFLLPFLLALVPYDLRLNTVEKLHHDPVVQRELLLVNLMHGLHMMVLLLPTALAILPGVVRACLRIKTLEPVSKPILTD